MDVERTVVELCQAARAAARGVATAPTGVKNRCLSQAAAGLRTNCARLLDANREDVLRGREAGLSAALLDRLSLTEARVEAMAQGLDEVAKLPDPVGETIAQWRRPNGLEIGQIRIPLGVVGVIYESRPNVTADAAALCLKAGNAVVLKGGSEALATNSAIATILADAAARAGLPATTIQLIPTIDRPFIEASQREAQNLLAFGLTGYSGILRMIPSMTL